MRVLSISAFSKSIALCGAILSVTLAGPVKAADEDYELDPEHTFVAFMVDHIGYANAIGMFREISGSFTFNPETQALSDLEVVIQTDSIYTANKRRDDHLRNPDFLNSREFPEMTFVMTNAQQISDTTGKIDGELTLLGQTRPLSLDVTLNKVGPYPFGNNYVMGMSARGTVTRSQYGMMYAVENGWVGDEIHLMLEVEAIRQ